jgi:signal transduction histidine kinase
VRIVRTAFHDRTGPPWQLIAGVVLAAVLITLATFQYRWIGEVGEAERARMRDTLQTRTADFTQAFDRELTQIYVAFHGEPGIADAEPAHAIALELARARAASSVPALIKDVFLVEGRADQAVALQRFNPERETLEAAEWPKALESWRARAAAHLAPRTVAGIPPLFLADAVDAAAPALIIPMPFFKRIDGGSGRFAVVPDPVAAQRTVIVWLDEAQLRQGLLEPLIARYFGTGETSDYLVSIIPRDKPSQPLYTSAADTPIDQQSADASSGMFDLRMNELTRLVGTVAPAAASGSTPATDRVAVTIVRRSSGPGDTGRVLMTGGAGQGAWIVHARYRSGSLETIVARSRRRNLAISAVVLLLLGGAFVLVMAAAQRQRRLARQQMEFVASVSHELRTPLAVICSAGENLADGVVADNEQVRTYGSLIETEGRRLGDMVERVMEFAGMSSGASIRARAGVDVAKVVTDAVQAVSADAGARDVTVTVRADAALPPLTADADALRSAVQNLVGNAVKYSANGSTVEVTAAAADGAVEVRVADRGLGIDAVDLPHIFEPFYRGRRAVDAQVRGTGVGLSVVRHVIASHKGEIAVDSRAGEGTTITVRLPA